MRAARDTALLTTAFVALLNHLLERSAWARQRLSPFAGRPARLMLEQLSIDFTIGTDGYLCASGSECEPEVTISAPLAALPTLIEGWERVMKSVRINGNAEMADALGFVFRNLRWDAEADLAELVGDVAAHRLHSGAGQLVGAQVSAVRAAGGNLLEYLTIERNVLLSKPALAGHADELRRLRDAVARTEKRVDRLERTRSGSKPRR